MSYKTPEELLDELDKVTEALKEAGIYVNRFASKSVKSIETRFKELDNAVKKSGGSYKDAITQLNSLADAIENDVSELNTAQKKKAALDELDKRARIAYNKTMEDAGKQMIGTVVQGFANYYVNQIKVGIRGLMGTSSPFQLAADLQIQAATDINATFQGLAGAADNVGTTLLMIPHPAAKVAGGLLMLGGALTGFVSSKATELFQEKTRIVSAALESTYNSFMEAASAGALYAGGLTELRQVALQSGLTQEQFTKVISASRQQLAEAGYGVTEGTRILGKVTQRFASDIGKSGQTLQNEMLNLGFSIEEQATLAADVIANIKRMGGTVQPGEVEQATADYAKNLRIIAEITGDDAKKKMAEAKAASEQYAFQKKFLREHNGDVGALLRLQENLAKMATHEQQAVIQMYLRGATNNVPAILAGFKGTASALAQSMHQTNFSVEQLDDILAKYRDGVLTEQDAHKEAIATSTAFTTKNSEVTRALTDSLNLSVKGNSKALNNARDSAEGAAATNDSFQGSVNASVKALQEMRNAIQTDLTGAISKFADDVPKILLGFREKLVKVGILDSTVTTAEDKEILNKGRSGYGAIKYLGVDDSNVVKREKQRAWIKDHYKPGSQEDIDFTYSGKLPADMPKFARGGIAQGPLDGYKAELHGTEAIIPLPDNKSIPVKVDMDTTGLKSVIQSQSTILNNILAAMQQNNKLTSGILQHSY